jgi:hypothetical protein
VLLATKLVIRRGSNGPPRAEAFSHGCGKGVHLKRHNVFLATGVIVLAAAAAAQQGQTFPVPVPDEARIDSYFVTAASDANLAEILAGRTALNKSNSDGVKQLARTSRPPLAG